MIASFTRQAAILDPDKAAATHVTVCGLGTVGSHAAVEMARMGIGSMTLIDGDSVEAHNLPSQAYELSDVGRLKTEALSDRVFAISEADVTIETKMLQGGELFTAGPVIMAVDNMETRRAVLEQSLIDMLDHPLMIDGRMGGKQWQLLALDPSDQDSVKKWVNGYYFPQDEAAEIPCGGRTVSFMGGFIGGIIASYICRQVNGQDLPFFLGGDLDNFINTRIN